MRLRVLQAPPTRAAPDPAVAEVVWRSDDGAVAAYGSTSGAEHRMRMPGLATFSWRDESDEVLAEPAAAGREEIEDAYRRCVLPMALHTRGLQVLHASAVRGPRGVTALCARSGTGKSTLAYGLSRRVGHELYADDAVAFDASGPEVTAVPLPFTLHLRPASAEHFGAVAARAPAGGERAPLAAVGVMERGAELVARRLTAADAFTAALQHAYCFDLEARPRRRETAERYLDLTARVPVYELTFPAGFERLSEILDLLEELA